MASATTTPNVKVIVDDDDPWLAMDKLQHFLFCFALAVVGFALASRKRKERSETSNSTPVRRLLAGALLAFLGGALKELGDFLGWWPGRPSLRDAAADFAGAAFGLAACAVFVSASSGGEEGSSSSSSPSLGDRILERVTRGWRSVGGGENDFLFRRSRGDEYRGLEMFSSPSSSDTKV